MIKKLKIESLLNDFPDENKNKSFYAERIKKYSNECGCSLGAKFLAASVSGTPLYLFLFHDGKNTGMIKISLMVLLIIFISGITGKLIGIGIAKIKLLLLYRYLLHKRNIKNL